MATPGFALGQSCDDSPVMAIAESVVHIGSWWLSRRATTSAGYPVAGDSLAVGLGRCDAPFSGGCRPAAIRVLDLKIAASSGTGVCLLRPHPSGTPLKGMRAVFPTQSQPDLLVKPGENLRIWANGNLVPALPRGDWRAAQACAGGAKKRISILGFLAVPMPQAGKGSTSMPDNPLLVASPSTVRLEPGNGEATKAVPPGPFPDGAEHSRRRAGSNSTDSPTRRVFKQDIIAVCHCGREFPVNSRSDDLPPHHAPQARGLLKAACHGSGRRAATFAEA